MSEFLTLDDMKFEGKTVLLRVDINCPLDRRTREILDDSRIKATAPTIKELQRHHAATVLLAHQGRPGDWDFVSLKEHASMLSGIIEQRVKFVPDIYGDAAQRAIEGMRSGEILLLENQRQYSEEMKDKTPEEHARSEYVKTLGPLGDYFVNDAFAAVHRSHCSLVGFTPVMPSAAGRLMESEVKHLARLLKPERPSVFIFGGAKFSDSIGVIEHLLTSGKADRVILVGLTGQAFLAAGGASLGEENEKRLKSEAESYSKAKNILSRYSEKILTPVDFAVDERGERREIEVDKLPTERPICDIGRKSMEGFKKVISKAKTVFVSGPAGVFEDPKFAEGTFELLESIVSSGAFSVVGGGHTAAALDQVELRSRISYVSTGGGALESFLLEKPLPALEALKMSASKFRGCISPQ